MTAPEMAPEHPGIMLYETVIKPQKINRTRLYERMGLSVMGLYKILNGSVRVNPEVAWKFQVLLGVSAEELLEQQAEWDLWKAKQALKECADWTGQPMLASPQLDLAM